MVGSMPKRNAPTRKSTREKSRMPDARVALFRAFYTDPKSEGFANCRRSAIMAGYSEEYADTITYQMPKWLEELLEDDAMMRADMLKRAQKNINSVLKENPETIEDKKIWFRASEYVSGTLGKDFYSTRQEVTGADGKRLFTNQERTTAELPVANLFKGVQAPQ